MVFGLFASVANDLMFLSVQVRLLIYLLPVTVQLPVVTCVLSILCILTVSKLQFRHRAARLRTHGFWLGVRWCSAFSHPLPPTSCLSALVRWLIYLLRSNYLSWPVFCLYCVLCIWRVSQLQFRRRAARFRVGLRWCSAFSHPLPTTSFFCLRRFGCFYFYTCYTCYGPLTCLVLYFNTCYGPLTCLVLCILTLLRSTYTCLVLCILIPATVH